MILSASFSKPVKNISEILGKDYTRVKIKLITASDSENQYFAEFYTEKQVFHKKLSEAEFLEFTEKHSGTTFKSCTQRTENSEITILANKKGKITRLEKKLNALVIGGAGTVAEGNDNPAKHDGEAGTPISNLKKIVTAPPSLNKKKNYLLPEGRPVPFLVLLGIMTAEGKVIKAKYDKFRQINRFLEFVDDILPQVLDEKKDGEEISVVDFGSGKSYLTFAVHYYLTEVKKVQCQVFGLDLKKDVINYCNGLAEKLELKNISFAVGDIASFGEDKKPDIIITLHACDTATDYALDYAVKHGAGAILSVPCCQHEINAQLKKTGAQDGLMELFTGYGLIKERFSALLTDAIRGKLLENAGYRVQMLEFIDENATPKNLLIRAVRKSAGETKKAPADVQKLLKEMGVSQTLVELLKTLK